MELQEFLTKQNDADYEATNDKIIYCQDFTDLPLQSNRLTMFEYEMWMFACKLGLCKETD